MHSLRLQRSPDSPDHLDRKLNLSRRRLGRRDQPGIADRTSRRIKDVPIVERRREIRVVDNVKKFRPELYVEHIGDFFDVIVFEEREIKIHQSRTDNSVPAEISPQVQAERKRKMRIAIRGVKRRRWS